MSGCREHEEVVRVRILYSVEVTIIAVGDSSSASNNTGSHQTQLVIVISDNSEMCKFCVCHR